MGLSEEQQLIVNEGIGNILVSAAAGAGKTTVLVARIIDKILKGEVSVDRLLVMTFTNAAAENMAVKIKNAIKKRLEEETDPVKIRMLKEQLNLMPSAYIMTIDSFCSRIIREKGSEAEGFDHETGLAPVSETEREMLLSAAASMAVKQSYGEFKDISGFNDSPLSRLVVFFDGRSDYSLIKSLVDNYKKLRSLPDYIELVEKKVFLRKEADNEGKILFLDSFILMMKDFYSEAMEAAKRSLDEISYAGMKEDVESIVTVAVNSILAESFVLDNIPDDPEEAFAFFGKSLDRLKNVDLGGTTPAKLKDLKETVAPAFALLYFAQGEIKSYKGLLLQYCPSEMLFDVFSTGLDGLLDKQKERTYIIEAYKDLLVKMDANYSRLKKKARVMDFADMEQYALEALKDPQVRDFYKEKFKEIYVDEYQDDSTLQDAIVESFADNNLFMVGDVKQSIYKFRYANPRMFINRMERYNKDESGKVLLINNNYRSTEEILNFVNIIFTQLMSGDSTEIEYDKSHMLSKDKNAQKEEDLPKTHVLPKILLISDEDGTDDDDDQFDNEILNPDCTRIDLDSINGSGASEIKGVIREITDYLKDPSHEPGDICILTRSNDRARAVSKVLNLVGIPSSCNDVRKLYEDSDIASICALITILGNEHRDESLFGIMLADFRFSNFTVNEISKIIMYAKDQGIEGMNLINKVRAYADMERPDDIDLYDRVHVFLDRLDELRSESLMFNISELIEKIYAATGILATVKEKRPYEVIKLRRFKEWLCESYMDRGSDISAIADSLNKLKIEMPGSASFEVEKDDDNAVSVMTFHKSKGLEFPFVIVTQIDSKTKTDESHLSFDERFGFIADDFSDEDDIRRWDSFESVMFSNEKHLEAVSEELRLFYVALTRAMNRLTIVSKFDPVKDRMCYYQKAAVEKNIKFRRSIHLNLKKIAEEFFIALSRINKAADIREALSVNDASFVKDISDFDGFELEIVPENDIRADQLIREFVQGEILHAHLNIDGFDRDGYPVFPPYEYERSVKASSKTSVSEIKKEELRLSFDGEGAEGVNPKKLPINLIVPSLDYFDPENAYKSASSKGTLIHNMLRFLDFVKILEDIDNGRSPEEALALEISFLKDKGIIKDNMMPVIASFENELLYFVGSDLFRRIAEAEKKGNAFFERPIMFSVNVRDTDDDTLVQGVLDVLFIEDGEAVIVDYKTDRIKTEDDEEIKKTLYERHGLQLDFYAASVEASGINVKEKIIWLVRKGKEFIL